MRVIAADQECFDDEGGNQRWQQSVLGLLFRCWRNADANSYPMCVGRVL